MGVDDTLVQSDGTCSMGVDDILDQQVATYVMGVDGILAWQVGTSSKGVNDILDWEVGTSEWELMIIQFSRQVLVLWEQMIDQQLFYGELMKFQFDRQVDDFLAWEVGTYSMGVDDILDQQVGTYVMGVDDILDWEVGTSEWELMIFQFGRQVLNL